MSLISTIFHKDNPIVIYTSDTCADCRAAKRYFDGHKLKIQSKNISEEQNREELKSKYGRMAVPTIIIGDSVFLGFADNKTEIERLLK